jgi:NAD(P)-dependent dehydrogenase (short-subunit alcohol dehydrogenase family)
VARRVLVTGASRGIGRAIARRLREAGYEVLGTCRAPAALADRLEGVTYLALDLHDPASVAACVRAAGRVDILVNNAGGSQLWPAADAPLERLRALYEANVFGTVALIQGVLPAMIGRGAGLIINIGSMTGKFSVPFQSGYASSKAALAAYTWSLRNEIRAFGLDAVMLEPGHIHTGITPEVLSPPGTRFAADLDKVVRRRDALIRKGSDPDVVARKVMTIVSARKPRPFYAAGGKAPAMVFVRRLMTNRFAERVIRKMYGL